MNWIVSPAQPLLRAVTLDQRRAITVALSAERVSPSQRAGFRSRSDDVLPGLAAGRLRQGAAVIGLAIGEDEAGSRKCRVRRTEQLNMRTSPEVPSALFVPFAYSREKEPCKTIQRKRVVLLFRCRRRLERIGPAMNRCTILAAALLAFAAAAFADLPETGVAGDHAGYFPVRNTHPCRQGHRRSARQCQRPGYARADHA